MEQEGQPAVLHTTQETGRHGNPLVIKGVARIESIVLQGPDVRRDARLYTHVFSRLMRRDFNPTSVKLFWYAKAHQRRTKIRSMLADLLEEAEALETMARPYEWKSTQPAASCQMRMISNETELLFSALIQADKALHKLLHSPLAETAEENVGPFMRQYTVLRREVFGFFKNQRPGSAKPETELE